MAINFYKMPVFHYVFRDREGRPAANGTVAFFKNSDQVTPKPVYEDAAGTIPFPNPINLNNAGVIADATGAPKPVYLENDEDYYIVVKDSAGDTIQTVENWNSDLAEFPTPGIEDANLTNYVLNPQFRYFVKQNWTNDELDLATLIAHEGWYFFKANSTSTNQIDFIEFTVGQTEVPYNPKYYLRFNCTGAAPETEKRILFKLRDVISFSGQTMSFSVWARSETGAPTTMRLIVTQRYELSPVDEYDLTVIDTFTVPTTWTKLTKENFTIPSVEGKTINEGEDEFEIALGMPLNQVAIIGFTNVQLNIGAILLEFQYVSSEMELIQKKAYQLPNGTIDETENHYGHDIVSLGNDGIAYRDTTGKIETYLLGKLPDFCLSMDGDTLERLAYIPGTNNQVTHNRLYQKWKNDPDILDGNAYGYGIDGFEGSLYPPSTAIFSNVNTAANTTWTDFNTGFAITTLHTNDSKGVNVRHESIFSPNQEGVIRAYHVLWIENLANGSVTDINAGTTGFSMGVLFEGTPSSPESSFLLTNDASTLSGGEYFTYDTPTQAYYVWFTVNGVGSDPAIGGRTGLYVPLASFDDKVKVSNIIKSVLNARHMTRIIANAAATLTGGEYFFAYNSAEQFYVWFTVDGAGTDPQVNGHKGIQVDLSGSDSGDTVATKIYEAVRSVYYQTPDTRGYFMRQTSGTSGVDPNADERYGLTFANVLTGNHVGTGQAHSMNAHWHNIRANCDGDPAPIPPLVHDVCNNYPAKVKFLYSGASELDISTWYTSYNGLMAPDVITTTGDQENRAINFSVQFAIRY